MFKAIKIKLSVLAVGAILMLNMPPCFADDSFQMIYEKKDFSGQLLDNQAFIETFSTEYGTLKFQWRKLWQSSRSKRMHLTAYMNDKLIADSYYPEVDYGYTFRAIKDTSNNRQFYVVQSIERAYLFGYVPEAEKLAVYIDSKNYAHDFEAYPYIVALKNGDLVLAFEQVNVGDRKPERMRYRFTWDKAKNWFGYANVGKGWESIRADKQSIGNNEKISADAGSSTPALVWGAAPKF